MAEVGTHVLEQKLERLRIHHDLVEAEVQAAIDARAAELAAEDQARADQAGREGVSDGR